ncbi:DUF3000 domain-containing protein [Luteococcus sp. OSA5]|uniref:DUF3000 domain-containing protein n=1 Tax=Luteococcus sp. OSA5 TaxID=3401630 RepID=UPI003B431154
MSVQLPPDADANGFADLVRELEQFRWRSEVEVERIPSPQRIAPFSVAVSADVVSHDEELGNGRLVLLHDPAGNDAWEGTHRCVTFARAEVDLEMVSDPLLAEVGWSWLTDALERQGAQYCAASGTVTAVSSRSFGGMQDEPDRAEVEIRASWTPLVDDGHGITQHLAAWQHLLCTTAGLPDLPPGIVPLAPRAAGARRFD